MLSTVLVAIDGTAQSWRALAFAVDLARRYDAGLDLVHVVTGGEVPEELKHLAAVEHLVEERPTHLGEISPADQARRSETRLGEIVGTKLLEQARKLAKKGGIQRVQTHMLAGDPAEQLLERAAEAQADLIVMGTRGFGKIKRLLVGSVSQAVANSAGSACLLVP